MIRVLIGFFFIHSIIFISNFEVLETYKNMREESLSLICGRCITIITDSVNKHFATFSYMKCNEF